MTLSTVEIESKATVPPRSTPLTIKDFKGKAEPDWCPGCGDFGVLVALKQALAELGIQPHQAMVISGIGCSSNLPGYISTYGMHTLHGRSLSVATGAQMANHELKITVAVDLTYIVMNNQVYGLTTGQVSPTSTKGMKTKSTPAGSVENPISPIPLAIAAGATYVARGYTGQVKHLIELIKGGIQHRGFSLIDAFSPCVTFNLENDHDFFKQRTFKLEDKKHDPTDFAAAMKYGYDWGDEIAIGLSWKRDDLPALDQLEPVLDEGGPMARRRLGIAPAEAQSLIRELM